MHVLYIHKNFPAEFGHLGDALARRRGWKITFASELPAGQIGPIRRIQYHVRGGASSHTHFASVPFENYTCHSHAVYEMLKRHREVRPDVIVSHSGFGTTLFLRDLLNVPIIHFSEWYYQPTGGDAEFGPTHGDPTASILRCKVRNAILLADLDNCTLGYCPTTWQRSRIPNEYQHKLDTIFDGIDTSFWRPPGSRQLTGRVVAGQNLPDGKKVVTYVSRGFETMRGFDVFVRIAKSISQRRDDVVFLCIGSDRVCYGGDLARIKGKSFRQHILSRESPDLERFLFTGTVPRSELVKALGFSDLHMYLTAPFVLSWSLMNALSCGCTVLASDTPPLQEVLEHGFNGLLAPYWDVQQFADLACTVLDDPEAWRNCLGSNARLRVQSKYSLEAVLPEMETLYGRALNDDVPTAGIVKRSGQNGDQNVRVRSTIASADPLVQLRHMYPWPKHESKQRLALHEDTDLLGSGSREALQAQLARTPALILELGAWRGLWTAWLSQTLRTSQIVAVDEWFGAPLVQLEHPSWRSCLPDVWESFVERCRTYDKTIIPIKSAHDEAILLLHSLDIHPQFTLVHPDYDVGSFRRVLLALAKCFPNTVWAGMNWHWPNLQVELSQAAARYSRHLTVRGEIWRLDAVDSEGKAKRWEHDHASTADDSALLATR